MGRRQAVREPAGLGVGGVPQNPLANPGSLYN